MSQYVTAFLTLNLGVEMVYVIAQRLNTQNIAHDRSTFVLNEIIGVLVSKELLVDITDPNKVSSHEAIKDIIESVAQSSIMRLDPNSMNKLWDLITMVFKWQLTLSQDLLKTTKRHVSELENYVTNPEILLQLRRAQNLIDNFGKVLSKKELNLIKDEILIWLKNFNVKVSLLLKMGLQNKDGTFVNANNDLLNDMIQNMGQNIYFNNYQHNQMLQQKQKENIENNNEVSVLIGQLLGEDTTKSSNSIKASLKLNICHNTNQISGKKCKSDIYENLDVKQNDDNFQELITDLNLQDNIEKTSDFKDDLLDLLNDDVRV